jgi:hypothetical protein
VASTGWPCNYFAFRPGGERANLILSKRARLRTASGVRLSRVAIAAVLSPAAAIDRSSPSFSGVHGDSGALISSLSVRALLFLAGWNGLDILFREGVRFRRGCGASQL